MIIPAYGKLAIAIFAEVVATSALKAADGFTRPVPSVLVIVGYSTAFWALSLALRDIPIGVAYAIWSGVGTVLVAAIAAVVYRQRLDAPTLAGMGLIIMGAVILNVFGKTHGA